MKHFMFRGISMTEIHGFFTANGKRFENTFVTQGASRVLSDFAKFNSGSYADFYIGLCGDVFTGKTMTLTDIVGEPDGTGNYARIKVTRDNANWGNAIINGDVVEISSVVKTFIPTADYNVAVSRMFLCNVASGTAGELIGISSALLQPFQIKNAENFEVQYTMYLI